MVITEDCLMLEIICDCGAVMWVETDSVKHREKCKEKFLKRHGKHNKEGDK